MIEREIEVFRAGRSSRGIGPDQLAEVAAFDCEANPLGICFGHPESDTPAAGTISKLRAAGNSLFATVKTLTTDAIEGIKSDKWLNRSFAFFDPTHEANPTPGKWAPRHLGLLGASAPGIPGMGSLKRSLGFDAEGGLTTDGDPADAVIFSGAPTPTHTIFSSKESTMAELTPEQIAENARLTEERGALAAERTAFEASRKTTFEAGNSSTVDALVAAGKVLPAESDGLKAVFNALGQDEFEFTAADGKKAKTTPVARLASFLTSALDKRVPVSERMSPNRTFGAKDGEKAPKSPAEITGAARKLMEERPGLTFEAAVSEVAGEDAE